MPLKNQAQGKCQSTIGPKRRSANKGSIINGKSMENFQWVKKCLMDDDYVSLSILFLYSKIFNC